MGIDGNVMQQGIIVYMESGFGKILTEKKIKERKRKERKKERTKEEKINAHAIGEIKC